MYKVGKSFIIKNCTSFGDLERIGIGIKKEFNYPIKPEQQEANAAKDNPATYITYKGFLNNHHRFDCEHRRPVKIDAIWNENDISLFLERSKFKIYYFPTHELIFFLTGKETANDLTKQLKRYSPDSNFIFKSLKVNFPNLGSSEYIRNNSISWFDMRASYTHITSEAVFGSKINEDNEYQRLKKLGYLKSSRFIFNYKNIEIIAQISHGISIWFPRSINNKIELDFLLWLSQYFYK